MPRRNEGSERTREDKKRKEMSKIIYSIFLSSGALRFLCELRGFSDKLILDVSL